MKVTKISNLNSCLPIIDIIEGFRNIENQARKFH